MHRRLRIAAPFAAMTLAVGLALGGGTVAAAGVHGQPAQPARIAGAGRMVGAGRTASRSAVPWNQVGPGWTLVTYTTANSFTAPPKAGATTLYLVDPAGGKYVIYRWPNMPADVGVSLLAWSGDGTRALLYAPKSPRSTAKQLDQLALASGKLTRLPLPASGSPISYTRPDGLAVLAYSFQTSLQLARYSLAGKPQKVLFTEKTTGNDGGGFFNFGRSPYNPEGTAIAVTTTPNGAVTAGHTLLISNAGGVTRRYRSADSCLFVRWWTASELLTDNCAAKRLFVTRSAAPSPSR